MGSDEPYCAAARRLKLVLPVHAMRSPTSNDQKFLHRELPRAIRANELEGYYRRIASSQGGRMVGVEVLLRWTHATRGAIGASHSFLVAEQMGLRT
jgi:sensor c-di-GMP phosphodiesterase-like protein